MVGTSCCMRWSAAGFPYTAPSLFGRMQLCTACCSGNEAMASLHIPPCRNGSALTTCWLCAPVWLDVTLSKKEKSTKVNVKSAKSHQLFDNKCPIFLTDTSQVSVKQSKAKVNV